jgi:hypothetical protein
MSLGVLTTQPVRALRCHASPDTRGRAGPVQRQPGGEQSELQLGTGFGPFPSHPATVRPVRKSAAFAECGTLGQARSGGWGSEPCRSCDGEKPVASRVWRWEWFPKVGFDSAPRASYAPLRAKSAERGLWRSHAEITCSPRRSRLTALRDGEWSRRLFATTRTRGTESAGAMGTRAFTRRRTARSGATSPRVARSSTVEPRAAAGSGLGYGSGQIPGMLQSPVCRRALISQGRRVGSTCTGCHVGGFRRDALGGR